MSITLIIRLVALVVCALAVRDDGTAGLELQAGAGADAAAAVSSAGDLHSQGHGTAGATHVCCVTFPKRGRQGDIALNVFHESATSELTSCDLTLITGTTCRDQASCLQECKERISTNKRYHSREQEVLITREEKEHRAIEALKQEGQQKHDDTVKEAEDAHEQGMQQAQEAVAAAEEVKNSAAKKIGDLKARIEDLETEMREAGEEEERAAKLAESAQGDLEKAREAKPEHRESTKALAAKELEETLEEAGRRAQELETKAAERKERFEALADQPVPDACRWDAGKGGAYASVDCCCSIHGIPMMVDKHFADWDLCLRPTKYSVTYLGLLGGGCTVYQECMRCRELVCGKEMCPTSA